MRIQALPPSAKIKLPRFASCLVLLLAAAIPNLLALERLDRGVAVFPAKNGHVYVGWRLLAGDPADVVFDVYRSDTATDKPRKLNAAPIANSTNFVDATAGGRTAFYAVCAVVGGNTLAQTELVGVGQAEAVGGYQELKFDGGGGAHRVGYADLDGDGKLEYLVIHPNISTDPLPQPNYWRRIIEPYKIVAYRQDGTKLWTHDMGEGIETGVWYSPVVAYDLDGDGKAEVYCKAGPTDPKEIVRNDRGMIVGGPEFLVKLDGETGRELARLRWPLREAIIAPPVDPVREQPPLPSEYRDYAAYSRNMLAVAYLDGRHPHLLVVRGTYSLITIHAYNAGLDRIWTFESKGEYERFSGQGSHTLQTADIDGDGRDEIVYGSMAVDDDGKGLWSTGRGHPDLCYVADIDPDRPGLEVLLAHEWRQPRAGFGVFDARTGEEVWVYEGPTNHVHGQGLLADIDPTRPGMEVYGAESNGSHYFLYDARGTRIGDHSFSGVSPRAAWWTADPTKLLMVDGWLFRFRPPPPGTSLPNTGELIPRAPWQAWPTRHPAIPSMFIGETFGEIPGKIVGIADVIGDWREEIIVSVEDAIRVYSTTIPADTRQVCLIQDRQYRAAVARNTMGYLYPPVLGGTLVPLK